VQRDDEIKAFITESFYRVIPKISLVPNQVRNNINFCLGMKEIIYFLVILTADSARMDKRSHFR